MERSLTSYDDAKNYPRNVSDRNLAPYALDAIHHELNVQAPRLFADESQAALDFLDLGSGAQGTFYVIPERIVGHSIEQLVRFLAKSCRDCRALTGTFGKSSTLRSKRLSMQILVSEIQSSLISTEG